MTAASSATELGFREGRNGERERGREELEGGGVVAFSSTPSRRTESRYGYSSGNVATMVGVAMAPMPSPVEDDPITERSLANFL